MTSGVASLSKLALIVILGIVLEWQVVRRSLVVFLADAKPEWAIQISPSDPAALAAMANRQFQAAVNEQISEAKKAAAAGQSGPIPFPETQLATIRALAERALASDPLNMRMLAILGGLTDESGDKVKARAMMSLVGSLSRQETMAMLWLLNDAWQARAFDRAANIADAVLRTRPNAAPLVVPVLARMAEDADAEASVQRLLASAPPWRLQFFNQIPDDSRAPLTPMRLLLSLKSSAKPATSAEYAPYLRSLIAGKRYANAYYTWLQSLSDEQLSSLRLVFNGGFERQPSGSPFDWQIRQGAGATIEFVEGPDAIGKKAMRVDLGRGRIDFGSVEQTLALAAGRYRLSLRLRGTLAGRRGLRWQVTCLDSAAEPLGETPMFVGVAQTWQTVTIPFDVPQTGCSAQKLALGLAARSASEQLVTGQVWYDDIMVERVVAPQ
jgi:hypothetical protein